MIYAHKRTEIELKTVGQLLELDGLDLLESAVLSLHSAYDTDYTSLVERKYFPDQISPMIIAHDHRINHDRINPLHRQLYQEAVRHHHPDSNAARHIVNLLPSEAFTQVVKTNHLLAIPTKTPSGEVMGVLLSSFKEPLDNNLQQQVIQHHQIFANIMTHTLREMWFNDRSEQLVHQLSYEVSHDSLTGLLNRSCLADTLESITQQSHPPFTLAILDIDSFKAINDMHGNYIGDKVLQKLADILKAVVPEKNLTFRTAGNEFAFITYHSDPFSVCDAILRELKHSRIGTTLQLDFNISIGLARSQDGMKDIEQLIFNTSLALKACKQAANTRVKCYDTHLSAAYHRKAELIAALKTELSQPIDPRSEQGLTVVVQPIVSEQSQRWDYFEVLARWRTNKHGNISPVEFIEVAEESGLIVELGERVIELACRAKALLENGLGYPVRLGINCSAHELHDSQRYLNYLTKMIKHFRFDKRDFVIELTETVLLSPTEETKNVLSTMRLQGFTIALDDFGTGYSSLNYIHSYPIDCIKIDATFIKGLLTSDTAESVVWLIVQLANRLGVSLVAEGVEHKGQLEKLHTMGCDKIQGFLFSCPLPARDMIAKIQGRSKIELTVDRDEIESQLENER
ncbi:putative bifunctional diguanylate cyclase/phosphodiesterase [Vibrio fortis]|uniref:putative bifunctional diguanylate cyclase/phosphodiesterase n=1 Tax=Vibrio fortis TaxID=212667 RepID=UPI0021C42BBC|nr:GGDEF domain-containing phosphodiesterase [Vibrio fortis]